MTIVDQIDKFTRLALKAQSQCRATLETLAVIKNPPVFARQANIANGPQQVNNQVTVEALPRVRADALEMPQTKLLQAGDARVDTRTAGGKPTRSGARSRGNRQPGLEASKVRRAWLGTRTAGVPARRCENSRRRGAPSSRASASC